MATIKVYAFDVYDPMQDITQRGRGKLPMAAIESAGFIAVPESEQEVDADRLSHSGRYHDPDEPPQSA